MGVLLEETNQIGTKKACVFYNEEIESDVTVGFCKKNDQLILEKFPVSHQDTYSQYAENLIEDAISNCEFVIVLTSYFSPALFYQLNAKCVEFNKMFFISYLDGNEGIIIPLRAPAKLSCYNDFELLRESSFYNLLDYQMMKEELNGENLDIPQYEQLHLEALLLNTTLLLQNFLKNTNINQYAYSYDFERMVNCKTKLMRFPNCPSCQGDTNISHPFI
ncbi:MAG: hypothetical protein ACRCZK_03920 [Oscillospiraceae bacterium]